MSDPEISQSTMDKLARYLRAGGLLSAPANNDDVWELGRSLDDSYCIDGQGRTLSECIESIPESVMEKIP